VPGATFEDETLVSGPGTPHDMPESLARAPGPRRAARSAREAGPSTYGSPHRPPC